MLFDDPARNVETQSIAAAIARRAIETIKDVRQSVGRDAFASIGDGHSDVGRVMRDVTRHAALDASSGRRVTQRVLQQIGEHLPQAVRVAGQSGGRRFSEAQSHPVGEGAHAGNGADGMGVGLHDLHAHVEQDSGYSVELHLEVDASLKLGEAHALADEFEQRIREALPAVRSLTTHIEPLATTLPDESGLTSLKQTNDLRHRITQLADKLAGRGACHSVELHNVNGHLTATLHITQPADQLLTNAYSLAEKIERTIHAHEPRLHRIVVHVEPPVQAQ